jgi:hypothetical protein
MTIENSTSRAFQHSEGIVVIKTTLVDHEDEGGSSEWFQEILFFDRQAKLVNSVEIPGLIFNPTSLGHFSKSLVEFATQQRVVI